MSTNENTPNTPTRRKLSVRQRKFIKAKRDGLSNARAKREAGYAPSTKTEDVVKSVKLQMGAALEQFGLTDGLLAQRMREGLDATTVLQATQWAKREVRIDFKE